MILGRRSLIGYQSGTPIDSQDTLSFSVLSGVRSMNEVFPLERAAEAYDLLWLLKNSSVHTILKPLETIKKVL